MRWLQRLLSKLTSKSMQALLLIIIEKVIVPRLTKFLQDKFDSTGSLPTEQELTEELTRDVTGTIERGEAFLNRPSS